MPKWLDELEAAHKAATPRPWKFWDGKAMAHGVTLLNSGQQHATEEIRCKPCHDAKLAVLSRNRLPDLLRIARAAKAAEEYVPCTCEPYLPNEQCPGCALRTALEGTDDAG